MSTPTKSSAAFSSSVQYLNDREGNKDHYVPHEVARRVLVENCSAVQSWREFLGKTTSEVAQKIGISEDEYLQLEALPQLTRRSIREKVANALEINPEQLKF
jgi:hypothetical protein